jgi:Ca2+-binding EF-hand superfamily protein
MNRLVMLAVCVASVLQAQDRQSFIRSFQLLVALDTDHDGVISAAEIAAAPLSLHKLDRNRDGKLSAEECAEGGEHGPSADEMVDTLMAFDKNGDGKLQRGEVPERLQGLFDRGDLNKDGVLTIDEIRKLAQAEQDSRPKEPEVDPAMRKRMELMIMRVVPVLAALDTDHNGEISETEMQNAAAVLKTLDKNGDGRLTDDEVTPDPLRTFVAQGMVQFDLDGDGRLSTEEMAVPKAAPFRAMLLAADRNHDGYVTEEELLEEVRRRVDLNHDGVVTQEELQRALQSGALGKTEDGDKKPEEVRKK